jgi:hypothetical protein
MTTDEKPTNSDPPEMIVVAGQAPAQAAYQESLDDNHLQSNAASTFDAAKNEVQAKVVANRLMCVAAAWSEFGIDSRARPAR